MTEAATRANIKTILEAVSNIGVVHDYERWAVLYDDLLSKFKTTISGSDVFRGWTITCEGWDAEFITFPKGVSRTYSYKIRGYFSLKDADATEKTAIALVEAVCNALDTDTTIHTTNAFSPPAGVDVFEPREFGNILCHYAEITQQISEFV
jgi:hypothetical protein